MNLIQKLKIYRRLVLWAERVFIDRTSIGYCGKNSIFEPPYFIENPKGLFLHDSAKIRHYCTIINAPDETVTIKKYAAVAAGTTFITNSHIRRVGVPHIIGGAMHVGDKKGNIVVEEDVWIGANATILPGVIIGRGAVVGTGALVTKSVPPYAVVVGRPAKIVSVVFSLEDIVKHESIIYPENERLDYNYLKDLFQSEYQNLRIFGSNKELTAEEKEMIDEMKHKWGIVY